MRVKSSIFEKLKLDRNILGVSRYVSIKMVAEF